MQSFIKIYHAVQDSLAFSLTVDGRTDRRAPLAKMMFVEASSPNCTYRWLDNVKIYKYMYIKAVQELLAFSLTNLKFSTDAQQSLVHQKKTVMHAMTCISMQNKYDKNLKRTTDQR